MKDRNKQIVDQLLRDMERYGRQRTRPDKWRAKFRKAMADAIRALRDGSPLTQRDTWRAICYLRAAGRAYAPNRRPLKGRAGSYRLAITRARELVSSGCTNAEIARVLMSEGIAESTAFRYAREARRG